VKKRSLPIPFILILCLSALLLSGCGEFYPDLVLMAVEAYAQDRGIIEDGNYSPMALVGELNKAMVADVTNDEDFIELDGVDVVKDIEKADQLADEALSELDTHKVESAVSIRPLDWRLQEKSGAVWTANGNGAAAETAYAQSDELLRESLLSGGNCTQLRRQQLQTRARSLSDAGRACRLDENCSTATYEEIGATHEDVMAQIQEIDSTGIAPFCPDP
jgi:hypothetical protein